MVDVASWLGPTVGLSGISRMHKTTKMTTTLHDVPSKVGTLSSGFPKRTLLYIWSGARRNGAVQAWSR